MTLNSSVIYNKESIAIVTADQLDSLKELAQSAPLKRSRLCLHLSPDDLVQEMVIVLQKDTLIRPHRHKNKSESFHLIEGSILVVLFDENINPKQFIHLSANGQHPFMYRLSSDEWHTVICLSEYAVFHEVTTGPFIAAEFPDDIKDCGDEKLTRYKERLLSQYLNSTKKGSYL